jgi:hypothetical protein
MPYCQYIFTNNSKSHKNNSGQKEISLFATRHETVGQKICKYWGEVLDIRKARQRPIYYICIL